MRLLLLLLWVAVCASQGGPLVRLQVCGTAKYQGWTWTGAPHHNIVLKSNGKCLDVEDYSTGDEAAVWTYPCHPADKEPNHQNQQWKMVNDTIVEMMSGKCLDRSNYGTTPGTQVWQYHCTGAFNQKWVVHTDGTIRAKDSGLCLDAGTPTPPPPRPCDLEPAKSMPFCDSTKTLAARLENLVGSLTLDEKMSQFANGAGDIPRLHIPKYQWWSEALHGVGGSPGVHFQPPTPAATSFPQVCLTGATFNTTLWHLIGSTISTEARAMNNVGNAGQTFWAPNVNIFRDPRWGRGQETPGEDPYHTSMYAQQFVTGMQVGEDPKHLKVSSCCKHYYDYNLENWGGVDRHHFDAITTQQDITDTYMPAFQSCIQRGHASSLMCSYNAVNGVPSCANKDIMTTKARQLWGFEGYITSDCGAVNDVIASHHYTKTPSQTCQATLGAGMDIDCGGYLNGHLKNAVQDGTVSNATVDQALRNLFAVRMRLGQFDPVASQPYMHYNYTNKVNTPAHQALALEASQQGIVMLKNDAALPLSGKPKVAVIGPSGDATGTMQGNYAGHAPYLISPLAGISKYTTAAYTEGCNVQCSSTSGFGAATKAASEADEVVLVVGLDGHQESEGHDRTQLTFPGHQEDLIEQVAASAKKAIIVIVMAGGPVDLSKVKSNTKVGAILWCGYPGQSGGQALADVLFGTYNPGGRLTTTVYPASFNKVSMFNVNMRPNGTANYPGRTYRFYTGEAVYPFGTGLSYTTFSYKATSTPNAIPRTTVTHHLQKVGAHDGRSYLRDDSADLFPNVDITVTNTGKVAGSDVVLYFVTPPHPGKDGAPLKSLAGFKRVFLQPGQSTTVHFGTTAHDLSLVSDTGARLAAAGPWKLSFGQPEQLVVPVDVL